MYSTRSSFDIGENTASSCSPSFYDKLTSLNFFISKFAPVRPGVATSSTRKNEKGKFEAFCCMTQEKRQHDRKSPCFSPSAHWILILWYFPRSTPPSQTASAARSPENARNVRSSCLSRLGMWYRASRVEGIPSSYDWAHVGPRRDERLATGKCRLKWCSTIGFSL